MWENIPHTDGFATTQGFKRGAGEFSRTVDMADLTEELRERIARLETMLEKERTRADQCGLMAEDKGRQYLREINKLSEALLRYGETEKDLRESEERYRVAIEQSYDGISIITDRVHAYVNRRLMEIFGYDHPDEVLGKPFALMVHPDDRDRVLNLIAMRERGEPAPPRYEFKGVRKDLTVVYVEAAVAGIAYKGNHSVLLHLRDVTDRKRLEEELLKADKLESLGILAGGIAHDFNNIMTAIMGNISLAKMATPPENPIYKRLVGAEEAVTRAKELTQQLLTFSKGGAPIKRTTAIAHILEDSVKFTLSGSNVRSDFSLPRDLWNIDVDEGQLSQVIQNLVINAKEAMPQGGVIEVKAENVTTDDHAPDELFPRKGSYVMASITDHGIGIPEEYIDKIFDPYFSTKQKGSGLGLATSYSIIRKHDGFIHVKSHLGIGTTFSIYLPAMLGKNSIARGTRSGVTPGEGKILLMDDEEVVRDTIGEMLSFLGYRTECAKEGVEAIDLYLEAGKMGDPFDLVILDLTVPGGMGGQEAMEEFLAIDPDIKAIVSSGYANSPIMSEFGRYGFVDVIIKPYKLEELSETVSRVINKSLRNGKESS